MISLELFVIVFFINLLTFLSAVESTISQMSVVSLKLLADKHEGKDEILNLIAEDRLQILIPLHLGTQTCSLTLSIVVTKLSLEWSLNYGLFIAFGVMVLVVLLFRQIIPWVITARNPERALLKLLPVFRYVHKGLRSFAIPISSSLELARKKMKPEVRGEKDEDATPEEIQAYIDVGEEEGILEKDDSRLVQSVVEFGDVLVKDVMTPRTRMVAIHQKASIKEVKDLIVKEKHSRIPVYSDHMDNIVGIAYIRNLLTHLEGATENDPVLPLIQPVRFVPETKRVSKLLREMQTAGDHMAIVIDEFGGVAGLVTTEDLIEEIVGEIRDEDQTQIAEVSPEGSQSYVLRGTTGIGVIEDLLHIKLNGLECSTVAGLIVNLLGRVPFVGEEIVYQNVKFEILEADNKRIHRLRVKPLT